MKKKVTEIVVRTNSMRDVYFIAEVKGNRQLWSNGSTAAEAIGRLLILRQKELGFKIFNAKSSTR